MHNKIQKMLKRKHGKAITILSLFLLLTSGAWASNQKNITTTQNISNLHSHDETHKSMGSPHVKYLPANGDQEEEHSIPEFEGVVIDDLTEYFTRRGPEKYWHEETQGYGDHSWWTQNTKSGIENVARWTLRITENGDYDLSVYIPLLHSTTKKAVYIVYHNGVKTRVIVNQSANRNSWYKLGQFTFSGTEEAYVELIDETGEPDTQYEIAFDALGYSKSKPEWEEKITGALWERVQPWLDEKIGAFDKAFQDWLNEQKAKLLQKMGDALKNWIDQQCAGLGAAMLLPLFAFIRWQKQRRKPLEPPKGH
jgi:hypothetical protein